MSQWEEMNAYAASPRDSHLMTTERKTAVGRAGLKLFALQPSTFNFMYWGIGFFGFSLIVLGFFGMIAYMMLGDENMLYLVGAFPFGFGLLGAGIGGALMLEDRLAKFAPSLNVTTENKPIPQDMTRSVSFKNAKKELEIPLVRNDKQIGAYSIGSATLMALEERIEREEYRLTRDLDDDGRGFGRNHKSICKAMAEEELAVRYMIGKTEAWKLTQKGIIWVLDDSPPY